MSLSVPEEAIAPLSFNKIGLWICSVMVLIGRDGNLESVVDDEARALGTQRGDAANDCFTKRTVNVFIYKISQSAFIPRRQKTEPVSPGVL